MRISCFILLALAAHGIQALQSNALVNEENFVINSIEDEQDDVQEQHQDTNETSLILDPSELDDVPEEVLVLPPVSKSPENYTSSNKLVPNKVAEDVPKIIVGPTNITAYIGNRVELLCQVSGKPKPKVTWYSKRDGKLGNVGANFRIHRNNSLIFRHVDKSNESYYHCVAKNRQGVVESPMARLTVEAKVNIVEAPDIIRAPYGTSYELQCVATGDPPPLISWLKDGRTLPLDNWRSEILYGHEYKPFVSYSRSVLRINVTEMANYTCYAINQMIGGRQSVDQESFMVYVQSEENDIEESSSKASKGYCAPYNGQVCRQYLQGRGLVWFNISQDNSGGWLNEQITQNLHAEVINGLAEPCKSAAEALLCKYAFPDCTLKEGIAVGLPLCQEDCMALRNHYCYKDWALIEDNKRRNVYIKSRGHFRLPVCEDLPKYSNSSKTCTKSSITTMRWDLATTNCVKGNGRFYQGHKNHTQSGLQCQEWFTNEPHMQTMPSGIFPEMNMAKNFCRNPGGTEPSPWCYTKDPMIRWQHCQIQPCGKFAFQVTQPFLIEVIPDNMTETVNFANKEQDEELTNKTDFMQEILSPSFIVLASCVAVATLIVILLIGLICNKLCSRKNPNGYSIPVNQDSKDIDLDKLPENMNYHQASSRLNPKLEHLEYPRNDIIYIRDVGQGAFGRVFQAKAPGLVKNEEFTMVAVKMLKEEASDDLIRDFEKEAGLLAEFDHPNIVKLLGVCAIGKPMCLLFEFMSKGDLNAYLRACSPSNYIVRSNGSTSSSTFSDVKIGHIEQINISKQVCSGMVYLSDRKFVHRDLASRNCLLDHYGNVKIADFGLSQKVYLQEYYRGEEQDAIPVRWMPLEAILHNKYTIESDVWAFGVLLWEIFSLALQPYYGLSHEEVVQGLKDGQVLQCPENTPKSAYKLMLLCWNPKPTARPTFRTLYRDLETIERELQMIQKHFRSQKSILSESNGRMTPQSPKSFV